MDAPFAVFGFLEFIAVGELDAQSYNSLQKAVGGSDALRLYPRSLTAGELGVLMQVQHLLRINQGQMPN